MANILEPVYPLNAGFTTDQLFTINTLIISPIERNFERLAIHNPTTWGRLYGKKGDDVVSANNITLGNGNYFDITGTTQINTISATDWTAGSIVVLQFDGAVTVKHATAGTGAQLQLSASLDFGATAGDMLGLIYDGTYWREIFRTAI